MLATTGNTSAVARYTRVKYKNIRDKDVAFSSMGRLKWSSQDSFAYSDRPVSLTIEVLRINILLFFFFTTTEVFTCFKVINAFKR